MPISVLVTGAGSAIGKGHLFSLRASALKLKIIATDIIKEATGLYYADSAYKVPAASAEASFIRALRTICEKERVKIIIVGSTQELDFFIKYRDKLQRELDVNIIMNAPDVIGIARDKWATSEFLRKNNFYFPQSMPVLSKRGVRHFIQRTGFPIIAKPRNGAGSRGVFLLQSQRELDRLWPVPPNYLLQEYIPDNDGEYTAGAISGLDGCLLHVLILKRQLQFGMTFRAEPVLSTELTAYCSKVLEALGSRGPCNLQMRLKDHRPMIFEINPRFSSSTYMRTLLGANELEMIIRYTLFQQKPTKITIKKGIVLREFTERFISTAQQRSIKEIRYPTQAPAINN